MVELVGDICEPSDLIVPKYDSVRTGREGDMFISGNKLWFNNGTSNVLSSD